MCLACVAGSAGLACLAGQAGLSNLTSLGLDA